MAKYLNAEDASGKSRRARMAEGGFASRMALGGMRGAERASWNVSNLPGASKLGLAGQGGAGGYAGMQKAAAADYKKKATSFETDEERVAFARSMTGAGGLMGRLWRGASKDTARKTAKGIIDPVLKEKQDKAILEMLQKDYETDARSAGLTGVAKANAETAYETQLATKLRVANSKLEAARINRRAADAAIESDNIQDIKEKQKRWEDMRRREDREARKSERASDRASRTTASSK